MVEVATCVYRLCPTPRQSRYSIPRTRLRPWRQFIASSKTRYSCVPSTVAASSNSIHRLTRRSLKINFRLRITGRPRTPSLKVWTRRHFETSKNKKRRQRSNSWRETKAFNDCWCKIMRQRILSILRSSRKAITFRLPMWQILTATFRRKWAFEAQLAG